ncbi:MAG: tetratricopeptide repeat protein [Phycisphaerae bacterium]|nr:tetratricopeptide repeat protein [Phycisphaerae bacterium]
MPRGSAKARTFTRGHTDTRRHFGHGYRGRHFSKGHRFGHLHKRDFGSVFYFVPFSYYPYYYPYYSRYTYPGYPYYGGAPYYDNFYYDRYNRPYDRPYNEPGETYRQPGETRYEQPDDSSREEYEAFQQERQAEQARVNEHLEQISEPFRRGDYAEALRQAEEAVAAQPDSPVLGFAYAQALVANGQYDQAAGVLRRSLNAVDMQTQGVLFGEDLYPDADALAERIADLENTAQSQPDAADLYLLLSYELIAAGRYDEVPGALDNARSYANLDAIRVLESIVEQLRNGETTPD